MTTVIVDASAALKWFFEEENTEEAVRLLDDRFTLHAPDFMMLEADSAVGKRVRRGQIGTRDGVDVRAAMRRMPIRLHGFESLTDPAFEIAVAFGCSVYDGLYVALAELLDSRVVTADMRLIDDLYETPLSRRMWWIGDL